MQASGQSHDFIRPGDLQKLSQADSEPGSIFSLYLDLRPGDLLPRFDRLLEQAEQRAKLELEAPADQETWRQNARQMRGWIQKSQPFQGQGLTLFSSRGSGLWRAFLLPAPVFDRLVIDRRPYLRPLEILQSEAPCTLVILADENAARWVEIFFGQAEEVEYLQAVPVTGESLDNGESEHIRAVIERSEAVWQDHPCGRLVISGSDAVRGRLTEALPDALRARLSGEISLAPPADLAEIQAQVEAIESEQEREFEARRVDELLARAQSGSGMAVLGAEQTLLAVKEKRVHLLIVDEDFHQPGGECPNCGFLSAGDQPFCLIDSMTLRPEADIFEVALKRVLDAGGEIEILRSPQARRALEPFGQIGALVHKPAAALPNKDLSNQLPMETDGKINRDVVHDEAIEESFPASDSPGWD